jgi:hypothetical protein
LNLFLRRLLQRLRQTMGMRWLTNSVPCARMQSTC